MKKKIPLLVCILLALTTLVVSVGCGGGVAGVTKPTVGTVPSGWSLEDDTAYPQYEGNQPGVDWGLLAYLDSAQSRDVEIWYGDIAPELVGHENDGQALIDYALGEIQASYPYWTPDDTGTIHIDGHLTGYVAGYDPNYGTYDLSIEFISGATSVNIYAGSYNGPPLDDTEIMQLINSIHVP